MACQVAEVMCHGESFGDVDSESEMPSESESDCQSDSERATNWV